MAVKLLAIDTALDACSAAILDGDKVLARVISPGGKGNAERLLPVLEQARSLAGLELRQLDAIAATIGPGSFTGIRTALATARALGLALNRPVHGVTTTEALAFAAAQPGKGIVAVIDARRGEVYLQGFAAADAGLGKALAEPQILPVAAAAAALPAGATLLVGSGAALLLQAAGRGDLGLAPAEPNPDPVIVARLAMAQPRPQQSPAPLYIRPPDAALPAVLQPRAALSVTLRPCGVEAADILALLHHEAFDSGAHGETWNAQSFRDLLAMPGALCLLALSADQPVGFLLLRVAADEAEVISLGVKSRLRRLGVAAALMRDGLAQLAGRGVRRCFLEVADDNAAARALYTGLGFQAVGHRRGYYAAGGDALVMQKLIPFPGETLQ
ncbi:MAG: tRNA (adenosine(37)-N6)-threonylcarbamoyltransferase complex dimerization subunit type 1 TsaB [Ferrovibrio sp.]